jgi:hypothetical protein
MSRPIWPLTWNNSHTGAGLWLGALSDRKLGQVFEDLIEDAIEKLVAEELARGVSWEG